MAKQAGRNVPKRTVTISDEVWDALTDQAWEHRMNVSELIRKLIEDFLTKKGAMPGVSPAPAPKKGTKR